MRLVYTLINFLSKLVLHPNPNGSRRIIDCFLAAPCQHLRRKLSQFGRIFIEQSDGVKGSADVKTCLTTWYSHEWTPLRVTLSNSLEWTIWMKCSKPRNHSCPNHLWMVVGLGNSPGYIIYLLAKSSGFGLFHDFNWKGWPKGSPKSRNLMGMKSWSNCNPSSRIRPLCMFCV